MPQDFSGRILRGRSFQGQNLAGVNFSYADIRGTNFTGANLTGTNFSFAVAGLQKRWAFFLIVVLCLLFTLSELALGITTSFVLTLPSFITALGFFTVFYIITIRYGLGWSLPISSLIVVAGVVGSVTGVLPLTVAEAFAVAGTVTAAVSAAMIIALVVTISETVVTALVVTICSSVVGALILSKVLAIVSLNSLTLAWTAVLLGSYTGWQALKGNEKLAFIRIIGIAIASMRSTSFRKANLIDANFRNATLKSADFRNAILIRTDFYRAKKLDHVRPGTTYLSNAQLRQLLVYKSGSAKNFDRQDLRGLNLQGSMLQDASFIGADLSEANLQDADLSRAKLVQTQLDKTDFTGAYLTGAYIENWGITQNTNFNGVRCEYVYMRLPIAENPNPFRKPDNRQEVFADGEFGDFIKPIFDTLDLYHSEGVDPRAIAISFKQLAENYPDAELEIVGMEKRGEDKFLLRAKSAVTADKSELSAEYFDTYNKIKALPEREIKLLLAEKDNQIRKLEDFVTTALERPSFYSQIYANTNIVENKSSISGSNINFNISTESEFENVESTLKDEQIVEIVEKHQIIRSLKNAVNSITNIVTVEVQKGSAMYVDETNELVLKITNSTETDIDIVVIELLRSAEYKVLSENPIKLSTLKPGKSTNAVFLLKMLVRGRVVVNYTVNTDLQEQPLYVNVIKDNPYIYGDPVKEEIAFFGRQKELDQIIQSVTKPAKQDILIVGERRTGKTSLLYQLDKRLGSPFIPVYIVLNTSNPKTEDILKCIFNSIVDSLVKRQLINEGNWHNNFSSENFNDNIKEVIKAAKTNLEDIKIVLLLDEADYLLHIKYESKQKSFSNYGLPFVFYKPKPLIDERVQNILRAALQSNKIGVNLRAVVAGTTDLSSYISQHSSPFFNHFRFVRLKPLTPEETRNLIIEPALAAGYSYDEKAIKRIMALSGGLPYYCQALCSESLNITEFGKESQLQNKFITEDYVAQAEDKILADFFDSYHSVFWNRATKVEKRFLSNLVKGKSVDKFTVAQIKRLLDWQIITEFKDSYCFTAELIQKWTAVALNK
ncbi:MAG: pentapeptide repeat-containing protein [Nostoc sp.]